MWASQGTRSAAPYFMPVEVANALHRRVVRAEMSVHDGVRLIETLLSSGLELHETPSLHSRTLELASRLKQGAVYDAHYLALAETLDCDLWTADEKFYRAASPVTEQHPLVSRIRCARIDGAPNAVTPAAETKP